MNQVVLITGGARGVGAAVATELARRGAKVVLTDLDRAALDETVAAIGADSALGVVADVCDLEAMKAAVARATERFGRLDTVLANAGIASYGTVLNTDPAAFKRVIDINITGVFNTAHAALPALIESQGYLLVVSSLAAFVTCPGLSAYNASKAGVEHLANTLRLEVKHLGVDVGCAHMSWIDTPLVQDAKSDLPTFRRMLAKFPFPLSKTTDVESCVRAFVKGIEKRSRGVYCPGWVHAIGMNRVAINSPAGNLPLLREIPAMLPELDADVERIGRATSARNVANDEDDAAATD
ncbi:MAG: SDR family oxidoreductase [Nocardioidaceae bacterium]|nr:SDR family oxidoreductase [Nocardioidaceae bacterium]MCL2613302.1 SDR family oxidoreductase [Nocardioidaceae bacterium]